MPGVSGPQPISDWMLRVRDGDAPSLHYVLKNLDPQTWYQLEVTALNNIGWSQPNDLFCFTTTQGKYILCGGSIVFGLISNGLVTLQLMFHFTSLIFLTVAGHFYKGLR